MSKKIVSKWLFYILGIITALVLIKDYIYYSEKEYTILSKKFYTEYMGLAEQLEDIDSIEGVLEIVRKEENQKRIYHMIEAVQQLETKTPKWKYEFYQDMSEILKGIIAMNECTRIEYKDISIDRRSEIAHTVTVMRADLHDWKNNKNIRIFW